MYRQYENPYELEEQLADRKRELTLLRGTGEYSEADEISIMEEIAELEDRVNFAWQDDEESDSYISGTGWGIRG